MSSEHRANQGVQVEAGLVAERLAVDALGTAQLDGDRLAGAFLRRQLFRLESRRFAREHTLVGVPVWMDVGRDDPFEHADTILADELRAHGVHVTFQLHGGGHSGWSGRMPEYLRWYANALARC